MYMHENVMIWFVLLAVGDRELQDSSASRSNTPTDEEVEDELIINESFGNIEETDHLPDVTSSRQVQSNLRKKGEHNTEIMFSIHSIHSFYRSEV